MVPIKYSIFTKPWPQLSPDQLGELVSSLGIDGIEFPCRDGFQVEPKNAEKGLPLLAERLREHGVAIMSVASELTEQVFAGCQAANIPLLRIMARFDRKSRYMESEAAMKKSLEAFSSMSEKYGVMIGVQHHHGSGVFNSMELRHLLEGLDKRYFGAIWDAAHSALSGESAAKGLDIVWDYLCLVNFKSAYFRRKNGPEALQASFTPYFTTSANGNTSWEEAVEYLRSRDYRGNVCFPAEYTDQGNMMDYLPGDIAAAKALFEKHYR
ncbi:MAG: sugar phosphate isomerase/epimerase family protein [Christensenellales bacterium]|jgi:sugar phosphate isomerase/epimerase